MKKLIALLLALVMVVGMVACGAKEEVAAPAATEAAPAATEAAKEEAPAEPAAKPFEGVTIEFCMVPYGDEASNKAAFKPIIDKFYEETGCTVEMTFVENGEAKTIAMARCAGGDAADVFQINDGNQLMFTDQDYLMPLDDIFTEEKIATFKAWDFPGLEAEDGLHYVVPFRGGAALRGIALNTTLCKELGLEVPAYDEMTWDKVIEYGKKAVEAGYTGLLSPFDGNANAYMINYWSYLHQAGGSFLDENGEWDLDSDASVAAFQYVKDLFDSGVVASLSGDAPGTIEEFKSGNALMLAVNFAAINQAYLDSIDFELEGYHLKGETWGTYNGYDSLGIPRCSENPEAAAAWVNYMLDPENFAVWMVGFAGNTQNVLNNLDTVSEDLPGPLPESLMHLMNSDPCDRYFGSPYVDGKAELSNILTQHQQLVAMGEETPREAADAIQAAVLASIGQ